MKDILIKFLFVIFTVGLLIGINWIIYKVFSKERYETFIHFIIGNKTNSEDWSNFRRTCARLLLALSWCIILLAVFEKYLPPDDENIFVILGALFMGVAFFGFSVVSMPFLQSKEFDVNIPRLLTDTLTSLLFMITCFSVIYSYFGIKSDGETYYDLLNCLYFSAVTFSTLGFGDFAPTAHSRPFAAFQAIIGNVHLGIIAGSVFAGLSKFKK